MLLVECSFAATPTEIERFCQVNDILFDLTKKMYSRSAASYRHVLTTYAPAFDDDVEIEGRLRFVFTTLSRFCNWKTMLITARIFGR